MLHLKAQVERNKSSEHFHKQNGNTDVSSGASQIFSELKTAKVSYIRQGLPDILNIFPYVREALLGKTAGGVPSNMFVVNVFYLVFPVLIVTVLSS